jgi:hypothetical protein
LLLLPQIDGQVLVERGIRLRIPLSGLPDKRLCARIIRLTAVPKKVLILDRFGSEILDADIPRRNETTNGRVLGVIVDTGREEGVVVDLEAEDRGFEHHPAERDVGQGRLAIDGVSSAAMSRDNPSVKSG